MERGGFFLIEDIDSSLIFVPEEFNDEQKLVAKAVDEFMDKEVLPYSDKIEEKDFDFLLKLMRKAGELGFLSADIPLEYDGSELDYISRTILTEKIARHSSFSVTWGGHVGIGTLPILIFGNELQKKKYLPKLATGELIGCYSLTEPEAGSDAMNIKTEATLSQDGKYYILNGTKQFTTNAGFADIFITFAKVDGKFTGFIIPKDTPGLEIGKEEEKMGIHGSSTCGFTLNNVKIPKENLLFEIGKGHKIAFNILDIGRYKLGVGCIGAAKEALKEGINYARERKQFGNPIIEFGLIKKKIAEMVVKIYAAESMAYRIANILDQALKGIDPKKPEYPDKIIEKMTEYAMECSILKVYATEVLDFVVDEVVQIYGGYGYVEDYPASRFYRDSRINRIFEGTNEINRLLIPLMLMKRSLKGEIPLMDEIQKISKEILTFSPTKIEREEGFLKEEQFALSIAKKMFLLSAGICAQKYKENLKEEQILLGWLADQIIEIYAMDSSLKRGLKIKERENLVKMVFNESFRKVSDIARQIIGATKSGDELRLLFATLRKLEKVYLPQDEVKLKQKIAEEAKERRSYPL